MNIRFPYIMNPIHEAKYSTTYYHRNGKITKKRANIRYRAKAYCPRLIIREDDIFA